MTMPLKIPVVIGRNRLRGNAQGAMVSDDFGQDNLARLHAALRNAAAEAGVLPTAAWLAMSVRQLLKLYEQAHADWQKTKKGTLGHVYEASLPNGETLLFGDPRVLARLS
ncbi:MAG: hypothetical protein OEL20_04995 [Sulfuritalea sp.]|nr:hypothetical protein [Sulfuritalea sp.]